MKGEKLRKYEGIERIESRGIEGRGNVRGSCRIE